MSAGDVAGACEPSAAPGESGGPDASMARDLRPVLARLHERVPLGMRFGLGPMRDACVRAGHPERAFATVHIAGTNGKGSTAAMVASIARAAGIRAGLYTSPHLVRFAERIQVDGEAITDERLVRVLDEALRIGADLSFFETATLAAFLAFRDANVELAVLEVGIGGRLDATNVIPPPRVAAITGIALDHQDLLGATIAEIAREKAGIAKAGAPLVLGALATEARAAILDVARAAGARIVDMAELPADVTVKLSGAHQRDNARVAWTIAAELGLPADARRRGTADVVWPGRFERIVVTEGPLAGAWILDGAHNPDGARALGAALADEAVGAIVFGALADKSWREMIAELAGIAAPRFVVAPGGRAPADLSVLAAMTSGEAAPSVMDGLVRARAVAKDEVVVVAGSLYLVGEARACLLGLALDRIVAL